MPPLCSYRMSKFLFIPGKIDAYKTITFLFYMIAKTFKNIGLYRNNRSKHICNSIQIFTSLRDENDFSDVTVITSSIEVSKQMQ